MLEEFLREETSRPYRDASLSPIGKKLFPHEIEKAIKAGDDKMLAAALSDPRFWLEFEPSPYGGVRKTVPSQAAERLARNEFNTWYVRGLARRLMHEGEEFCQVYRAADNQDLGTECSLVENKVLKIKPIYDGHRAKLRTGDPKAFSIPAGEGCYHTIRRLSPEMKALIQLERKKYGSMV